LFDLLLIFGVFHVTLGSARIGVANGEILSRTGILGIATTRRIQVSEVPRLCPSSACSRVGASGNALYAILLRTKNGRKYTLADEIDSARSSLVVAQIETLAGLKLDTHVEVDATFGVSSPPPQPGTGQVFTRRSQNSPWPPPSLYCLVTMAMLAGSSGGHLRELPGEWLAHRTSVASECRFTSRLSAQMTDADVERVLALPAQDQAEELLERAIGHDERALELFDQHIEGWIGHIRMSDRMRQLERRSQFSKDLRVRYANADINLALDGWQKTRAPPIC